MLKVFDRRPGATLLWLVAACLPLAATASWPTTAVAKRPPCCTPTIVDDLRNDGTQVDNAAVATCVGAADCRACKNCSSCRWCKGGGTCGVCASSRPPAPKPPRPAVPVDPGPSGAIPSSAPAVALPVTRRAATVEDGISVHFSPNGGCTDAIVHEIAGATRSVKVLAQRLTSPLIADALLAARRRAVAVTIVLDRAQQTDRTSDATVFATEGCTVLIDSEHEASRNHVILIDDAKVITGSFSFTTSAELKDAENLLVIQGKPTISKAYAVEFAVHVAHAVAYRPPTKNDERGK